MQLGIAKCSSLMTLSVTGNRTVRFYVSMSGRLFKTSSRINVKMLSLAVMSWKNEQICRFLPSHDLFLRT
jgi:hypothetical protein